jgi:FKBP-type peptidyl-prolyl cis-trans isomerase FkpA
MNPTASRLTVALSLFALLAGSALSMSCGDAPTAPTPFAPFSQEDLRSGTGDAVVNGNTLLVHYSLWLYAPGEPGGKGPMVESSRVGEPFRFTVGQGQVIGGWDQGVLGMQQGGLRRLVVPPSRAYGGERRGNIPPHSTLVFEIDLLEIVEVTS